uniref:Uncharacterized protein n=1 Tax=Gossypium raimondii TaxID=29730 RepID=A0A0D2N4D3_GOSRA|nr:hypothetical protein B456_004G269900 [Gossypium raimondii]
MCCSLLEESPCRKLFETGLELSLARLKALTKFAIGMGLTQVILVTPIGESSLGEGREHTCQTFIGPRDVVWFEYEIEH